VASKYHIHVLELVTVYSQALTCGINTTDKYVLCNIFDSMATEPDILTVALIAEDTGKIKVTCY
jgi:hypothetical protein